MSELHDPLVEQLYALLEEDDRVLAAWLEGSLARDEDDDYSDIDIWICLKNNHFDEFIDERDKFATQLGGVVSILYPMEVDHEDTVDSFRIILDDQPVTCTIDVNVQKRSRQFTFTEDSVAEECVVLFDKADILQKQPLDREEVEEYARDVFTDMTTRFWHRLPKVSAHIARNDMLEAIAVYRECLEMYIVLQRIVHSPEKLDWTWKDVEYDLPKEEVKALYQLLPSEKQKTLQGQQKKLAKRFAKFSKTLGGRMDMTINEALVEHVLESL